MFSKRGEKQFAPHGTKAVEHFAEIFLHLMGNHSILYRIETSVPQMLSLLPNFMLYASSKRDSPIYP